MQKLYRRRREEEEEPGGEQEDLVIHSLFVRLKGASVFHMVTSHMPCLLTSLLDLTFTCSFLSLAPATTTTSPSTTTRSFPILLSQIHLPCRLLSSQERALLERWAFCGFARSVHLCFNHCFLALHLRLVSSGSRLQWLRACSSAASAPKNHHSAMSLTS